MEMTMEDTAIEPVVMKTKSTLRAAVDLREAIQRQRIAFKNRQAAVERGDDTVDPESEAVLVRYAEAFQEMEDNIDKDIRDLSKDYEIINHAACVKGMGRVFAAKLVSMIDITRCNTVSALWRYCGYAVIDGERERPHAGEKMHYNKRCKVTCYLIATSMMRSSSPYRRIYDNARTLYDHTHPDWTAWHKHSAAIRKMIKIFLSHLWNQWRTLEGLPTRLPYPIEYLGHTTMFEPVEFGWPVLIQPIS